MRSRKTTIAAGPRSSRTGQRSQWITIRPLSSRITARLSTSSALFLWRMSAEAPGEHRCLAGRAERAEVLVLTHLEPAARRPPEAAVVDVARARGPEVEARVAAVA
jgi:hypothetical protein